MSTTPPSIAHKLARPNILQLQPYRCARDDYNTGVLLDANENAFGSPPLTTPQTDLHRYPDPYQHTLKQAFLSYRGYNTLTPAHMFAGVGSDEAIDLLLRIFCQPASRQAILTTPPTYGMYQVCAAVNDVSVVTVPLLPGTFQVPVQEIIATARDTSQHDIQLIFLCHPGNPTAKALSLDDIAAIAKATAESQIVIVDEAYIDFSSIPSAVSLLQQYPNLCVLQTLSKAVGLAAIRCGFLLGHPSLVQLLNNVKAPYNVNALTSAAAIAALTTQPQSLQKTVTAITTERTHVMAGLQSERFADCVTHVYPSDANFILFQLDAKQLDAEVVYKTMADRGVVVRFRGRELHCTNCLRATVGTAAENAAFLDLLRTVVDEVVLKQT